MGLVFAILGIAVFFFVTGWIRVDVVALGVLVALAVTDLITPEQALSGFSNPAVITVWAVFILSGGLAHTGVAGMIGQRVLLLAGNGQVRLIALIMLTAAGLSAFMNNVGVAALLLPVVMDISRRTGHAPSKLLIPLAFSSLLGGLTTLIGTPPNLLVTDALAERGRDPFTMFDFTPVGVSVVLAGIAFMIVIGRRLLPDQDPRRQTATVDLEEIYELGANLSFISLPPRSALEGKTLAASRLRSALGLEVVAIFRRGASILAPGPATTLHSGDRLLVQGGLEQLSALQGKEYLTLADEDLPVERLVSAGIEMAEIRCTEGSPFIGQTLRDLNFRRAYGIVVLALRRTENLIRTRLETIPLRADDVLLVQGTSENLSRLAAEPTVVVEGIETADAYELEPRLMAVRVPENSALAGKSLVEARLGEGFDLGIMGILRDGVTRLLPEPDERLQEGDTLLIKGRRENLASVEGLLSLEIRREEAFDFNALESDEVGLAEVVLSPRTTLAGRTLRELHFREKYGLTVMAISREGRILRNGLGDLELRFGDALLLHGDRHRLQVLGHEPDFLVLTQATQDPVDTVRAPIAAIIMAGVVSAVVTGWLPIQVAAASGALLMVLTGCLTMDDAYRAIEWRAVFLIAGMLPMGIALQETGAALWLTDRVIDLIGEGSPLLIVAGLYVVTALGAQVMPTAAVAILMAPIALNTAADLGLSPEALLMTVALSASASFMSPVAHPANVLIMGPGGYRFSDYTKVGLPLTLVCLTVVLLVLPVFWPLQP
jgi:di/tricarboxylate transporter